MSYDFFLCLLIISPDWMYADMRVNPGPDVLRSLGRHAACLDLAQADDRHWFYLGDQYGDDILDCRNNYKALRLAPPLDDRERLPALSEIRNMRATNRAYESYLRSGQAVSLWHFSQYQDLLADADWRYRCWDAMDDARRPFCCVGVRRAALLRLRDLIGFKDYYAGDWPAAVPFLP